MGDRGLRERLSTSSRRRCLYDDEPGHDFDIKRPYDPTNPEIIVVYSNQRDENESE